MTTARPTNAERAKEILAHVWSDIDTPYAKQLEAVTLILDTVSREEREACAKIALGFYGKCSNPGASCAGRITDAIRARAAGKVGR